MANHGGAKFVSVNLNKSYGQHHPHQHQHHPHHSSYGPTAGVGRGRGGGGGMLVLSRARGGGAPKVASKLSVPPPLNLPSLRKEHEKFDVSGPPGAGGGGGSGARPTSSGMGWTKPATPATALLERNESVVESRGVDGVVNAAVGVSRGTGSYMPPSARAGGLGNVGSGSADRNFAGSVDKAVLLRGEDFPSLQDARPVSSGTSHKHKDGLNQKQKQVVREELVQEKEDGYHLGPLSDVHSVEQSYRNSGGNRFLENGGKGGHGMFSGRSNDQIRKPEEYFSDPLPMVRMNPRSDWADDERDTGHVFVEQRRDTGFSSSESYWDRDFDLLRQSVLPHKPAPNQYDKWGQRDNEAGKRFSSEVLKTDPYNRDVRAPSREGKEVNKWRTSPPSRDGFSSQEIGNYRVDAGPRMAGNNNMVKENKYSQPQYGDIVRDGNRDSAFGRRDMGLVGQQQRNNTMDLFNNRGTSGNSRDRHVTEQSYSYRGDNFQSNNNFSKSSFASSGKMPHAADPILNMGRDKRYSNSDKPFSEDPFSRDFGPAGFDERDIFSDGLVGVIKRKKDAAKSTDFHDPVRESFEAELERVQKMQELERQRVIEEQERALEQARREEEERQRRIREEEERRRRLEEEAREAAWRAEQEHLEAIRKAEELRISREEEKRRIQLEEERRKQAALQKLQELEAKMAKRQAETSKDDASSSNKTIVDEKLEAALNERLISRNQDLDTWEDGERMVESVTNSGSFDLSAHSTVVEMNSRQYPPREGSSNFVDRGKGSWKRDVLIPSPLLDQETGHYSPRREAIGGGRATYRKEFHGGAGFMPSRAYNLKAGGVQEPYADEFGYHHKDQRWNLSGNAADSYGKFREMDSEFHDSIADKFGDSGWGQGPPRGNSTRPPYPERLYPHPEANDLYSYGRSRYSMRQPRVLPPPSVASAQRSNPRFTEQHAGPSAFLDNDINFRHAVRTESTRQNAYYDCNQDGLEPTEIFGLQQENNSTSEGHNVNNASMCDSQSSLSVSSPPTSPPQLSHDELDESGESRVTSSVADGKRNLPTESVSVVHIGNSGNGTTLMVLDSVSAVEDEEWALENDNTMQQQEEYDEDEDGYREEDEVRERDDENLELTQKFEGLELEEEESPHVTDNVVLGFDEGVEVVIPSDDFEKNFGTPERSFEIPESSVGIVEERGTVDGFPSDEPNYLPANDSHGTNDDTSATVPEKSKSALQGSDGTDMAAQQTTSAIGDVNAATSQTNNNIPSSSTTGSQGDLPVKLQFGLFSGPSLIPSPVPAIQIGSIRMPLHIHPPVGQPITHMHPSQPPMFQFGQLHYTSPISQGILPMGPQSMSFLQPNMMGHFNLNPNAGTSATHEPSRDGPTHNATKDEVLSHPINSAILNADSREGGLKCDEKIKSASGSQAEEKGQDHAALKTNLPSSKAKGSESQLQHVQQTMQSVGGDRNYSGQRGIGSLSGGRGRRFAYAVKSTNTRSSFIQDRDMPADLNGFQRRPRRTVQRTEFRIRENNDRRLAPVSSNNAGLDDKSNYYGKAVGVFTRSGSKRGTISNRTMKQRIESEPLVSGNVISQEVSGDRAAKEMAKDLSVKSQHTSHPSGANLRRNASEEDVDAPLPSGVVRVFKQPGIEAPSDEGDFIEVRSKRQMLNDRREQREKEIKAKSRTDKPPRKPRASRPKDVIPRSHNKLPVSLGSEEAKSSQLDFATSEPPHFSSNEVSTGYTTAASHPPIGTPAMNSEAEAIKSTQAGSVSVVSNAGKECEQGTAIDSKNKVMSLSQSQIDEAMKPARYDSHISAVGSHSTTVSDPILPTSSILKKDKSFSSGASPINSLLAGEKIQFGAVTSPTVLPPSSRVVSHGIGAPGSNRSDVRNFPVSEKEDSLFFSKDKSMTDPVQDSEAEAEAAASAVAVAAISSDEIGNGLGSVNESKSFGADINGIATGVVGDQHLAAASRSQSEELLSVSLPADLSVETTPISLWPPLPSPQSSSSQMLSHFPAGPPSHFPFYDMNPLLGGPIFAFSPHEESSGTQSQLQKSTPQTSGPLGNWQQCHSGVDSFYGAPAGYPGPFIGPPGGIPGVQGPPHMVVYNHFAPVGQYGQVGLSFMGATYIPSGKQVDWKNGPTSSGMHIGDGGEMNNANMSNVQRSAPTMTAPIQHLAPGSPLLPMPPPMPMFDVSPFQVAPDLSVQARWGHIPASPLHPVPVSRLSQPQVEGGSLTSQVNHGSPIDQSLTANNRFTESRTPTQSDKVPPTFTVSSDTNAAAFPSQLGLVDSIRSSTTAQTSSGGANGESGKTDTIEAGKNQNAGSLKSQFPKKNASTQQGNNNTGGYNNYQRGGFSHRNNMGNEFSHRRMGYHGRNQSSGADKGFHGSKVKQIYVAKQTTNGSSTT